MKIVFIYIGSENLGLEYLSAALKSAGHTVKLVFDPALFGDKHYLSIDFLAKLFDSRKSVINQVVSLNPDMIGFSVFSQSYQWAIKTASLIKKEADIPIIFGGIHPTICPERVISNECVDMVCVGEGEDAIVELANSFKYKKEDIRNIWFKNRNGVVRNPLRKLRIDLDNLPFADKSIFEMHIDTRTKYMITTSRGCPFSCTFCNSPTLREVYGRNGEFIRLRSPDNVLEELISARKRYNFEAVDFKDDIFTINAERMKVFLSKYKRFVGLPFMCLSHPSYLNKELAKLLKESGCCMLQLGVQSMNECSRRNILNRRETNSDIETAINSCNAVQLPFQLDHLFGIPGEDEKILAEAAGFYAEANPQRIGCYALTYFPKTKMIDIALAHNLIDNNELEDIENGFLKLYHSGGSIKDRQGKNTIKSFMILFRLIPLLPKKITKIIIGKRWYRLLKFMPFFTVSLMDLVGALKYKNYYIIAYIRYYLKYFLKSLLIIKLDKAD